ncbi:MAG: hypothetical protein N2316_02155 [Spirochaetes bacterium]|nr:hypothetical protein [Spirochaetota bacterium]
MSVSKRKKEMIENDILLDEIIVERVGESEQEKTQRNNENVIVFKSNVRKPHKEPENDSFQVEPTTDAIIPDLISLSAEIDRIKEVSSSSDPLDKMGDDLKPQDHPIQDDIRVDGGIFGTGEGEIFDNVNRSPNSIDEQSMHDRVHGEMINSQVMKTDEAVPISEQKNIASKDAYYVSDAFRAKDLPKQSSRIRLVEEVFPDSAQVTHKDPHHVQTEDTVTQVHSQENVLPQKDNSRLSITLPEDVAESLAKDFDIHSLQPVDLREAEKIANEDILILTAEDLIEELDAMDLIPIDDETTLERKDIQSAKSDMQHTSMHHQPSRGKGEEKSKRVEKNEKVEEHPIEEELMLATEAAEINGEDSNHHYEEASEVIAEPIVLDVDDTEAQERESAAIEKAKSIEIVDEFPQADADVLESAPRSLKSEEEKVEKEAIPLEVEDVHGGNGESEEIFIERNYGEKSEMSRDAMGENIIVSLEKIPQDLAFAKARGKGFVIDDVMVERERKEDNARTIFLDSELERTVVGVIGIGEGSARVIPEATQEEDQEQLAAIMSGTTMAFEDLLVDFSEEYKFKDEDIAYIDEVFIGEAVREADFSVEEQKRQKRKLSPAMEIFGLSDAEIHDIENSVFLVEYKEVDFSKVLDRKIGLDQAPADFDLLKNCRYVGSSVSELTALEKQSIERDLTMRDAVVFEESIEDIRRVLLNYRRTRKKRVDDIIDITDEIVIIDDSSDVERFVNSFEPEKRQDLKKLLKYLDGLFEWLPEELIRKFANSEYYNLYVKIMNELEQ